MCDCALCHNSSFHDSAACSDSSLSSPGPHQIFHEMLQSFGPATHVVVSGRDGLKDCLMQSQLGSASLVREAYRHHRLVDRPTGVIFEGISENKPLRLHDLLIYASLSLYDPLVVARGVVTAALARLRETRTRLGVDGMTVDELRKDLRRSHGDMPGSA